LKLDFEGARRKKPATTLHHSKISEQRGIGSAAILTIAKKTSKPERAADPQLVIFSPKLGQHLIGQGQRVKGR
jgi:hypothetical protein